MNCINCGFETNRPNDWRRHLQTQRHLSIAQYVCQCENVYTSLTHLNRHKKTCVIKVFTAFTQEQQARDEKALKDQITRDENAAIEKRNFASALALRDNGHSAEITKLHSELAARPNVTFNLSFFLNDTCKNAPSLANFMNGIPLRLDTEQSMSQFILDKLSRCAIEERPIHCTDVKRGNLAIKQGDCWEQDQTKMEPLVTLNVNALRQRYMRHISSVWCPEHPDYLTDDKVNTEWTRFMSMICNDLDTKFMLHLAKATSIPKE